MTTAAIYARKSKATDKGESTENQINRGISLCKLRGWDYVVYEDYDVSGKNLDRPEFKRMLNDAHEGKISNIICYKLDRISRSVNDFSNLIEELNGIDVGFICIKDNFDTSTPMGRAMMYITSVFAQLERETIAERVKDNMIDRAKLGKWNGGPVPYGFNTKTIQKEYKGKMKKVSKLIIDPVQAEKIKEFYSWYLESDGSIRNCVTRANEKGYRTSNNAYWSHNQMSRLLQNPLYCINDAIAYQYFKNNTEVEIANHKEDYDSQKGLMFYNRRKQHKKTSRQRNEEDWILAIGEHKGIIPGETFVKVQRKLNLNKNKAPRTGTSERSALAGLVRCGRCGSSMSVFASPKTTSDGNKKYYYYFRCITREQKSKTLCDNSNVRADILEDQVISYISKIGANEEVIEKVFEKANNKIDDNRVPLIAKRNSIQKNIDEIQTKINNLVDALGSDTLPAAIIKKRYEKLEIEKQNLIKDINNINVQLDETTQENINLDKVKEYLLDFKNTYDYLDVDEKRKMLQSIIKEISIDRDKVKLQLYFDIHREDNQALCLRTDKLALAKSKIINIEWYINDYNNLPESTLGERIRKIRIKNKMTQKELALKTKLTPDTICNIENERVIDPSIKTVNKISTILCTTNNYLLNLNNCNYNEIKKYRLSKGYTQREFAKILNVHQSTLLEYENGKIKTQYKIINKINDMQK